MGTNFYRIPPHEEMVSRKMTLLGEINGLSLSPSEIERGFNSQMEDSWDWENPWKTFTEGTNIHLGKRSSGWKFCWNFHNYKYYSNKKTLLEFIRLGRVVDEYGVEQDVEEFITMALEWGEPDGLIVDEKYRKEERRKGMGSFFDDPRYDDLIIDGLRVASTTEFS